MLKKYKKHTLDERIKWLKAIEDGDSVKHVSIVYGIDHLHTLFHYHLALLRRL